MTHGAPEPPYSWEGFLEAARRFARSAAQNYSVETSAFLYLHAGASVELLLKSALCRLSPALLLEGQRFSDEALIRIMGFTPAPKKGKPSTGSRNALPFTVSFAKAAERFATLYGTDALGVSEVELNQLKALGI